MTDKGKFVNKRTHNKRTTVTRKPTPAKRTKKNKKIGGLKNGFNLVIIWSLVVLNAVLIFSLVHKIVNMQTPNARMDQRHVEGPPEDPMTVLIHNGCGVPGLAKKFQDVLVKYNYDVRSVGNASDPYDNTVIIDRSKRDDGEIEELRELIGLKKDRVVKLTQDGYTTDVKIIIGKDYSSLKLYKSNQ